MTILLLYQKAAECECANYFSEKEEKRHRNLMNVLLPVRDWNRNFSSIIAPQVIRQQWNRTYSSELFIEFSESVNHWCMNRGQLKDPVCYLWLYDCVVRHWTTTQEVACSNYNTWWHVDLPHCFKASSFAQMFCNFFSTWDEKVRFN